MRDLTTRWIMPFVFGTDNPEIIPSKMQRLRAYIGIRSTVFFVKQYRQFNNSGYPN